MTDHLEELTEAGVSIWLDDLSRERIETGNLADLVKNEHVVGVTTNPSIFAARSLTASGTTTRSASSPRRATTSTGRCSRSPPPTCVTPATSCAGLRRHQRRRRPRLDRGGPRPGARRASARSTRPRSCGARWTGRTCSSRSRPPPRAARPSRDTLGEGISVNVTLIFGLDRYHA